MKHAVKMMSLAALLVGMSFCAQAQFRQSVFFNVNAPVGDFGSKVTPVDNRPVLATPVMGQNVPLGYTEIGKNASVGFGLGYRISYRFDVGMGMVAPFAQADFFWNSISGKLVDEYRAVRADNIPTYFNIPVQIGVSYLYDQLWNDITPYAEFGIGVDGMIITGEGPCHWTDEVTGGTVNSKEYAYDPSFALAYSFGLGAYFGRHVSAGIYYYGLGAHTIDYTQKTIDNNLVETTFGGQRTYYLANPAVRNIGSLALRIGFHF